MWKDNPSDPSRLNELSDWYDACSAAAWPDTEHSPAYPTHLFSDPRATLVSPALRAIPDHRRIPEPAEWLEVFEIDNPDPLHAYPQATSHTPPATQIQPQLSQSFCLADARTNGAWA